jgi:hypothetical protein
MALTPANPNNVKLLKMNVFHESEYFDIFSTKYLYNKYQDILCAVPYWSRWIDFRLEIPYVQVNQCLSSGKRMVFMPFTLETGASSSHANAVIIDTKLKTAERFEPHGAVAARSFRHLDMPLLDKRLKAYFEPLGIAYIRPSSFMPFAGPQTVVEMTAGSRKVRGYCAVWSLWYTDVRMANPDEDRRVLTAKMIDKFQVMVQNGSIAAYMQRFLAHIYHVLLSEFPGHEDVLENFNVLNARNNSYIERRMRVPAQDSAVLRFRKMIAVLERRLEAEQGTVAFRA